MTINDFIACRPYLVWSTKDYKHLSKEAIVEAVLNYGTWEDVQKIFAILGIKKVAKIFFKQLKGRRTRNNYDPKIRNYFQLYFRRYA